MKPQIILVILSMLLGMLGTSSAEVGVIKSHGDSFERAIKRVAQMKTPNYPIKTTVDSVHSQPEIRTTVAHKGDRFEYNFNGQIYTITNFNLKNKKVEPIPEPHAEPEKVELPTTNLDPTTNSETKEIIVILINEFKSLREEVQSLRAEIASLKATPPTATVAVTTKTEIPTNATIPVQPTPQSSTTKKVAVAFLLFSISSGIFALIYIHYLKRRSEPNPSNQPISPQPTTLPRKPKLVAPINPPRVKIVT